MLSCKDASQLVSQSLDRKLLLRELIMLRLHLMLCSMCRRFEIQMANIRLMARHLRQQMEQDQTVMLPIEAKQRIASALEVKRGQGR